MLLSPIRTVPVKVLTLLIWSYRYTIALLFPPSCRYTPTCSQYAIEALNKYGVITGLFKTGKRVLRCHPFSTHSSYDPA
ncbi:MAG: membrane protein insertion efficiency factor YidD [Fidelibacterota bacterium]|nr:MAG: membrane protein insertion efficiency factor YidD [Candidatus Neomarinimicrobiota bacterium]